MQRLKTYFEVKPYEVLTFRIWAFIVSLFFPIYGLALLHFVPDAIENMTHRWSIATGWALLFLSTFISKQMLKYLPFWVLLGNMFTTSWVVWIVFENNFSFEYSITLAISFICLGAFIRDKYEMAMYLLLICVSNFIALFYVETIGISTQIYGLSFLICFIVLCIVILRKESVHKNITLLNEELLQKNQELEQFVYVVSHDLKSPLRTMGSFASLLKRKIDQDDEDALEYADFIVKGAVRMDNVINDLLTYSRYAHENLEIEEINLSDLIEDVWNSVCLSYPDSQAILHQKTPLPEKIQANNTQLRQLFQNLFDNGIKYNSSEDKQISISYQDSSQYHLFTVHDNGIGIPLEYKHKVFKLFQRLHTGSDYPGTGVGLAICKRIVENHKGIIQILPVQLGTSIQFSLLK